MWLVHNLPNLEVTVLAQIVVLGFVMAKLTIAMESCQLESEDKR